MDRLADVCEQVARRPGRLRKVAILADYFRTLNDEDLSRAVRFLCCGPVAGLDRRGLAVGYATITQALLQATPWDPETVGLCYREVGDGGEAIGLLLRGHTREDPLSLLEAEQIYMRLYKARRSAEKIEVLRECFSRQRPLTTKYFVKVLSANLRIGLQAKTVEEAVAAAAGVAHASVRDAVNRSGNLPAAAIAARSGTLESIEARLFHPMDFMLAKPLDRLQDLPDPASWIVEDKYDGIRAQAHVADGRVLIYTRGYDEVTGSYPEVAEALRRIGGSAVFDGELLGWRVGRAIPFTVFQQRLARKKIDPAMLEQIPVVFIAYDLLYRDGRLLLDAPIEERRSMLAGILAEHLPLMASPDFEVMSLEDVDRQFGDARSRGNEGLVLKRRGSLYEPGRRSGSWLKVKRPYATLDVVITAAEHGSGKRATVLSDYTFGVRDGDRFLNVGKAYSGLTDEEIRELTRILRAASTDRFGRTLLVRPEVVLEVAFDSVQRSPRHKSGFALRFPRIVRWRRDKTPDDADTLERVRDLYEACLAGEPAAPKG